MSFYYFASKIDIHSILKRLPDIFKVTLRVDTLAQSEQINCKSALKELAKVGIACKSVPAVIEGEVYLIFRLDFYFVIRP